MSVCSWWHPFVWILLLLSNGFTSPFRKKRKRIVTITNISSLNKYHIKTLQGEFAKKSFEYTMDMKIYLRTQSTLYEEDRKEEASMWCSLLHGSWDQILQRRPSVRPFICCYQTETTNQWVCGTGSWWVTLTLWYSQLVLKKVHSTLLNDSE